MSSGQGLAAHSQGTGSSLLVCNHHSAVYADNETLESCKEQSLGRCQPMVQSSRQVVSLERLNDDGRGLVDASWDFGATWAVDFNHARFGVVRGPVVWRILQIVAADAGACVHSHSLDGYCVVYTPCDGMRSGRKFPVQEE